MNETTNKKRVVASTVVCLGLIGLEVLSMLPFLEALETWYPTLEMPWFMLSNEQMVPVAAYFYGMVGFSLYRVWSAPVPLSVQRRGTVAILLSALLNTSFNPLVFGTKNLLWGALFGPVFCVCILWTCLVVRRMDRVCGRLFALYLGWAGYATVAYSALYWLNH